MVRVRLPGGVCSPAQWLKIDELARAYGQETLRLTTRQTVQLHGIIKSNLKPTLQAIDKVLLNTIAACGDVNRNVMCNPNPYQSRAHAAAFDLHNIGQCYVDYARLMDHLKSIAPGFIHSLGYEQLVDEPETVLRRLLGDLGLEWDEALLRFYESDRSIRTPSVEQVRRPLNRSGIGTWKPYAEWLGPLRDALGPLASEQA